MTTVQDAAPATKPTVAATGRQRVAALLVVLLAAAMVVTGIVGIGTIRMVAVVLCVVAAVLLLAAGWVLLRRQVRWPAVTLAWLSAIGVIAELGDYQARKNNTGALGAINTTYFLPGLLWLYMFLLIVAALLIGWLSAMPKGQQRH